MSRKTVIWPITLWFVHNLLNRLKLNNTHLVCVLNEHHSLNQGCLLWNKHQERWVHWLSETKIWLSCLLGTINITMVWKKANSNGTNVNDSSNKNKINLVILGNSKASGYVVWDSLNNTTYKIIEEHEHYNNKKKIFFFINDYFLNFSFSDKVSIYTITVKKVTCQGRRTWILKGVHYQIKLL